MKRKGDFTEEISRKRTKLDKVEVEAEKIKDLCNLIENLDIVGTKMASNQQSITDQLNEIVKYILEVKVKDNELLKFACHVCKETFDTKGIIISHNENYHFKKVTCEVCKKDFRLIDMKKHKDEEIECIGCSRIVDGNGTTSEYSCNSCDHKSKEFYAMKEHIKTNHFLVKDKDNQTGVDLEPVVGVTMEKKKYALNELKALEKKRDFILRENSIRDDKGYKFSSSLDLR